MPKILGILAIIFSVVLFPPAALALISNNAVPGDATYPIKRVLEDGIFAVVSINENSKAWFAAARSNRRFKEFSSLIERGEFEEKTLTELVEQTKYRSNELKQVTDLKQKKELIEDLSKSLAEYNQGLKKAEVKVTEPKKDSQQPAASVQPANPQQTTQPQESPKTHVTVGTQNNKDLASLDTKTSVEQSRLRLQQRQLDQARAEFDYLQRVMEDERKKTEELLKQLEEQKVTQLVSPSPLPSPTQAPFIQPTTQPTSQPTSQKGRLLGVPVKEIKQEDLSDDKNSQDSNNTGTAGSTHTQQPLAFPVVIKE